MVEMVASIRIIDLEEFNLFREAAPDWLYQVSHPDYVATDAEKKLFGAIMSLAETKER